MPRETESLDQIGQLRDVVRDHDVPPSGIAQPVQYGFNVRIDGAPLRHQDVSSDSVERVRRRRPSSVQGALDPDDATAFPRRVRDAMRRQGTRVRESCSEQCVKRLLPTSKAG
jgi:hypothetical protein